MMYSQGVIVLGIIFLFGFSMCNYCNAAGLELKSYVATYPYPYMNGLYAANEWQDANVYICPYRSSAGYTDDVYIYLMNDDTHLYIAIDLIPDTTADALDNIIIYFDLDNNGIADILLNTTRDGTTNEVLTMPGNVLNNNLVRTFLIGYGLSTNDNTQNHATIEITITISTTVAYNHQDLTSIIALPLGAPIIGMLICAGFLQPKGYFGNTSEITDVNDGTKFGLLKLNQQPPNDIPGFSISVLFICAAVTITVIIRKTVRKKNMFFKPII